MPCPSLAVIVVVSIGQSYGHFGRDLRLGLLGRKVQRLIPTFLVFVIQVFIVLVVMMIAILIVISTFSYNNN